MKPARSALMANRYVAAIVCPVNAVTRVRTAVFNAAISWREFRLDPG